MLVCNRRCYHHNEMKPQTIGRALGIGLRVAGKIAGQRMAGRADGGPASAPGAVADAGVRGRAVGQQAGRTSRGIAAGLGGFLRPFRRVGGILWLEVMGGFFLLPVAVFAPTLWRTRPASLHGPWDKTFLFSALVMAVFFYLSVSSFWRARKR
jgi:hypothetical protein